MPAVSQSQQRLMGQAYALKKGDIEAKDIDAEYRKQIQDLADGMTLKDLKDFAETKHDDLPVTKESYELDENSPIATLSSVNGMGPISLPQGDKIGSGDNPNPSPKKKKAFKNFKDFIKGQTTVRAAF
jgi:hypothetical protein